MKSSATRRHRETVRACNDNDPPIEVNQVWSATDQNGQILRRLRILALHPDPDTYSNSRNWIYCDIPGGRMRTELHSPRVCPEFNLRYVFTLEDEPYQ